MLWALLPSPKQQLSGKSHQNKHNRHLDAIGKSRSAPSSSSKATNNNNKAAAKTKGKKEAEPEVVEVAPVRKSKNAAAREQRRQALTTVGLLMVIASTSTTLLLSSPSSSSRNKNGMISLVEEEDINTDWSGSHWDEEWNDMLPKSKRVKRSSELLNELNDRRMLHLMGPDVFELVEGDKIRPSDAWLYEPDPIPPRLPAAVQAAVWDRSSTHEHRNDIADEEEELPVEGGEADGSNQEDSNKSKPSTTAALPSSTSTTAALTTESKAAKVKETKPAVTITAKSNSVKKVERAVPDEDEDDLFDDNDDEESSISAVATPLKATIAPAKPAVKAMVPDFATVISDDEEEDDIFAEEKEEEQDQRAVKADTSNRKIMAPAPAPVPAPVPAAKPVGFLGRIFGGKSGAAARPADFKTALTAATSSGEEQLEMRQLLGLSLLRMLPDEDIARPFEAMLPREIRAMEQEEAEQAVLDLGLEPATVAAAFADLTNALVVSLVDRAASVDNGDGEKAVLALEQLSDFSEAAGGAYGRLVGSEASIEPIVYNGKSRANRLEGLYGRYMKSCMDLKEMFGAMAPQAATADGAEESISEQEKEEKAQRQQLRQERLGRLQFLFSIKENKRASIEQRVFKDLFSGGGAGGQDMQSMMKSLMGGQGTDGMDEQALADMLQGMQQGEGGGGAAGLPPDMANMSQEEMAEFSRQALATVKQQLEEGTMSLAEVLDFEKMLGQSCEELVKGFEVARRDPRAKAAMAKGAGGAELADLEWIFKQLAAIKKKGGK